MIDLPVIAQIALIVFLPLISVLVATCYNIFFWGMIGQIIGWFFYINTWTTISWGHGLNSHGGVPPQNILIPIALIILVIGYYHLFMITMAAAMSYNQQAREKDEQQCSCNKDKALS